jgi:hypothetical protein
LTRFRENLSNASQSVAGLRRNAIASLDAYVGGVVPEHVRFDILGKNELPQKRTTSLATSSNPKISLQIGALAG